MKIINYFIGSIILLSTLNTHGAIKGDKEGVRIATKSYESGRGWKDYVVSLQMEIRLGDGRTTTKYLKLKNLEGSKDNDKSLVVFERPADVKGTALLTHSFPDKPNDQWLYLPDLRRTKRMVSRDRNQSFMGSEFTYDDMAFNDLSKYTYKFIKKDKCGDLECFVVEQTPTDKDYTYSKLMVWYDNQQYRVQKTDLYDKSGQLVKQLERKGYKKFLDKVWFPSEMVMKNVQTKNSTVISFDDYKFKTGLSERDFTPEQLNRIR